MDGRPMDRRIGNRRPTPPVQIRWQVPKPKLSQRLLRKEPEQGHLATIANISVTGAAVIAPWSEDIGFGTMVHVLFGETPGVLVVRRIDPHTDPARRVYGVEFSTESPLAHALHAAFLDNRA